MNTRPFSWMICASAFLAFMVLCPLRCAARSQNPLTDLRGQVIDENGQPVPRVEVDLRFGSGISQTIYTDTVGRFQLRTASISQVHLSLSKPGFFRIEDRVLDLAPGVTACGRFRRSWRMRVGGYTSLEGGKGKLKYYLMGSRSTIPRAGTLLPKLMSML